MSLYWAVDWPDWGLLSTIRGRVFEAESEPGGHARSHEFGGAWFDQGAYICHSQDPSWLDLVCVQTPMHEMTQSTVLNYKAGDWFAYPVQNHLADLSKADCEAALKDFLQAQEQYKGQTPQNYEEWCRFQYGDFLLENFDRLYTKKYWHVPMAELATDWLGGAPAAVAGGEHSGGGFWIAGGEAGRVPDLPLSEAGWILRYAEAVV